MLYCGPLMFSIFFYQNFHFVTINMIKEAKKLAAHTVKPV